MKSERVKICRTLSSKRYPQNYKKLRLNLKILNNNNKTNTLQKQKEKIIRIHLRIRQRISNATRQIVFILTLYLVPYRTEKKQTAK